MPVEMHFAVNMANFNHAVLSRPGTYKLHLWFVSGLTLIFPTRMTVCGTINQHSTHTECIDMLNRRFFALAFLKLAELVLRQHS